MVDFNKLVSEFSTLFNSKSIPYFNKFDTLDEKTKELRISLIEEELKEYFDAYGKNDLIEIADAIGDSLYVAYGMGYCYGIPCYMPKKMDEIIVDIRLTTDVINKKLNGEFRSIKLAHVEHVYKIPYILNEYIKLFFKLSKNYNFDIERVFVEIHNSNISKACSSEQEAKDTIEYYLKEKNMVCYYKPLLDKFVVYRTEDDKVCKSIKYKKVDLSFVLENR